MNIHASTQTYETHPTTTTKRLLRGFMDVRIYRVSSSSLVFNFIYVWFWFFFLFFGVFVVSANNHNNNQNKAKNQQTNIIVWIMCLWFTTQTHCDNLWTGGKCCECARSLPPSACAFFRRFSATIYDILWSKRSHGNINKTRIQTLPGVMSSSMRTISIHN